MASTPATHSDGRTPNFVLAEDPDKQRRRCATAPDSPRMRAVSQEYWAYLLRDLRILPSSADSYMSKLRSTVSITNSSKAVWSSTGSSGLFTS